MNKKLLFLFCLFLTGFCKADLITVDDDGIADFNNIQAAINSAVDGDIIIVQPGLYQESINFLSKNIVLTSTNPSNPNVVAETIIGKDDPQYNAVDFEGTEGANCILSGFNIKGVIDGSNCFPDESHTHATITNCLINCNASRCGTIITDCDGIIRNCLIADNGGTVCACLCAAIVNCHGRIENFTIIKNDVGPGVEVSDGETTITNSIIYGNHQYQLRIYGGVLNVSYCDIQGGSGGVVWDSFGELNWGPGNIDVDPCFVREGYWDFNEQIYVVGDYHLQSEAARWDPDTGNGVTDANTSACIDAGNPGCDPGNELMPNGNRINMGAYGGTPTASKSPENWRSIADLTNNGMVDFYDLAILAEYWLQANQCLPSDLDRSLTVDMVDLAILANEW